MDIVSHGLWTHVAFRAARQTKKAILIALLFGVAPDLVSFGSDFVLELTGIGKLLGIPTLFNHWRNGIGAIPHYVYVVYDVSHSLLIFLAAFFAFWLLRKRAFFWPMASWGLHILIDIPSHSRQFFATPFLWPISDYRVNGINWGTPAFFFANWVVLLALYGWIVVSALRKRLKTKKTAQDAATDPSLTRHGRV